MSQADPVAELIADLGAEHADLDVVVAPLGPKELLLPTPAAGWTVVDQLGHLGYFDRTATQAIVAPDAFAADRDRLFASGRGPDAALDGPRSLDPLAVVAWWRDGRAGLLRAAEQLTEATRLPWYGPSMGARSFLTARLMETWAHGQDIVDAVGAHREAAPRLRHIAHLGVITRGFSYAVHGLTPPAVDINVALDPPVGEQGADAAEPWTWGDPAASDRIGGPALDFCLVVTQRRPAAATRLSITGEAAKEWMGLAQAFAGAPTVVDPSR